MEDDMKLGIFGILHHILSQSSGEFDPEGDPEL